MADVYNTTPTATRRLKTATDEVERGRQERQAARAQRMAALRQAAEEQRILKNVPGYNRELTSEQDFWSAYNKGLPIVGNAAISPEEMQDLEYASQATGGAFASFASGLRTGAGLIESTLDFFQRRGNVERLGISWEEAGDIQREQEALIAKGEDPLSKLLHVDDLLKLTYMRPDLLERNSGWNTLGEITAAILDPTSLLPLVPFTKAGMFLKSWPFVSSAALSGGLGAADMTMLQLARDDELDLEQIAMVGGVSAVLAPLLVLGGQKLSKVFRKGEYEELEDADFEEIIEETRPSLLEFDEAQANSDVLAGISARGRQTKDLVDQYGIPGQIPESRRLPYIPINARELPVPVETAPVPRGTAADEGLGGLGERLEDLGIGRAEEPASQFLRVREMLTQKKNEVLDAVRNADTKKLKAIMAPVFRQSVAKGTDSARTPMELAMSTTDQEVQALVEEFGIPRRPDVFPHPIAKWRRDPDGVYEFYDDHLGYQIQKKGKGKNWELYRVTGRSRKRLGQYKTLNGAKRSGVRYIESKHGIKVDPSKDEPISIVERRTGKTVQQFGQGKLAAAARAMDELNMPTPEQESVKLKKTLRNERQVRERVAPTPSAYNRYGQGQLYSNPPQLMVPLTGGLVGLGVGGDVGSMAVGAALAAGAPVAGKWINTLGRRGYSMSAEQLGAHLAGANLIFKPLHVIRDRLGTVGEEIFERFKQGQGYVDRIQNEAIKKMERRSNAARAAGKSEDEIRLAEEQAMKILQKRMKKEEATQLAIGIASDWGGLLAQMLRQAHEDGVIDAKKYRGLSQWAAKEGYFPRVLDQRYLHSPEGEAEFIRLFSEKILKNPKYDENKIRASLYHITNNKDELNDLIKSLPAKDAAVQKHVEFATRALRLYQRKSVGTADSKHLERSRKLFVDEEVMAPFLVKDPRQALLSYVQDVGTRVGYAKVFGGQGEKFKELSNKIIERGYGANAKQMVDQIFYDRTNNPLSTNIQRSMEQSVATRKILGKLDAFETLKLSMAAVVNAGQVPINGSILAARMMGGNVNRATLKPLFEIMQNKDRSFWANADKAAAGIETTILQRVAEHTNLENRLFGRDLNNPLDYINNPSKFLKATGFVDVERFNRSLAANWGMLVAKDLLKEAADLRAAGKKAPRRLTTALEELGFGKGAASNRTPVTEEQIANAGLRFSDMVNFRQQPGELPMIWSHPNAKLFVKFKQFAFNHGNFLFHNLVRPVFEDNAAGAAGAATSLGTLSFALGVPISDLRKLMKGDDEDYSLTEKWVHGLVATGGAGILYDILTSRNPLRTAAGPAASDALLFQREIRQGLAGNQSPGDMLADMFTGSLVLPKEEDINESLKDILN
jgi:hypothetical protein